MIAVKKGFLNTTSFASHKSPKYMPVFVYWVGWDAI